MAQTILLTTEQSNPATENLDLMTAKQIVQIINREDHKVAISVGKVIHALSQSADVIANRLTQGGRLFIFGAGTSGRLGVMNAVFISEKYGLPSGKINGFIAGGDKALRFSIENSEDDCVQAIKDLKKCKLTKKDIVWGISAGGGAPYILQILKVAQNLGVYTIGYSSNTNAKLKLFSDIFINPVVGPEVLTGSSRMKSGSAQEMALVAVLEAAVSKIKNNHLAIKAVVKGLVSEFKIVAPVVKKEIFSLTKAVKMIADAFNNGGRLFYFGVGMNGRLGVLDASECWPTFGVNHGVVNGYIAGGDVALRKSFDCSEKQLMSAAKTDFCIAKKLPDGKVKVGDSKYDVVIGLENNLYSLTALKEARKYGLKTILFATTKQKKKDIADVYINPIVNKIAAPIATKFVLNTLTTASMVLSGKTIGNKMVDVAVMNNKLADRAVRIVSDFTRKSYEQSENLLSDAMTFRKKQKQDSKRHVVPLAIIMGNTGLSVKEADRLLIQNQGLVRLALKQYNEKGKTVKKYRIIGNMTGNSMDAIDLVLTEFDDDKMKDVCSFSQPYTKTMQSKMEALRKKVGNKTRAEILALPEFKTIHDEYVRQVANCINAMCKKFKLDKSQIDAIGFHGKTLDHNPPSRAKVEKTQAYTLQIGSGKMLADLTGIKVVYDFRSAPIMAGFDGAPLVPPHNAHIAVSEGDGCYYNGGNTSNLAWIVNGVARIGSDAGPFNEYVDNFVRENTKDSYDVDGKYGKKGKLNTVLLQKLFDVSRDFYERKLPKSGDPQFYRKDEIFAEIKRMKLSIADTVHTLEYFAAYIAVQGMTLTNPNWKLPPVIILFGGGWKNPVVRESFERLMCGKGYVLPEHKTAFFKFLKRFYKTPVIRYSQFGESMEARLFADLARYNLEDRMWEIPEIVRAKKKIVCGVVAEPQKRRTSYDDMVNLAAKGWQSEGKKKQ